MVGIWWPGFLGPFSSGKFGLVKFPPSLEAMAQRKQRAEVESIVGGPEDLSFRGGFLWRDPKIRGKLIELM